MWSETMMLLIRHIRYCWDISVIAGAPESLQGHLSYCWIISVIAGTSQLWLSIIAGTSVIVGTSKLLLAFLPLLAHHCWHISVIAGTSQSSLEHLSLLRHLSYILVDTSLCWPLLGILFIVCTLCWHWGSLIFASSCRAYCCQIYCTSLVSHLHGVSCEQDLNHHIIHKFGHVTSPVDFIVSTTAYHYTDLLPFPHMLWEHLGQCKR